MGRTISLKAGSFLAKRSAPKMQEIPPIIVVPGAPMTLARMPAKRLPKGTIPMKAMV
jgi:hypothetical protein